MGKGKWFELKKISIQLKQHNLYFWAQITLQMSSLRFHGHESFHCRHFWLKKGYDYKLNPSHDEPTVALGVGKNMVSSISFWLKAFDIFDDEPSEIANYLFKDEAGKDPFLEDLGTLWLLQYQLVKSKFADIYHLIFLEFRKRHLNAQFTEDQIKRDIIRQLKSQDQNFSERTIETDIKVFLRNYITTSSNKRDIEDDMASIFIDLGLIQRVEGEGYKINISEKRELPTPIFAFCVLDAFSDEVSVSFDDIQAKIGDAFACNKEGLEYHIEKMQAEYNWLVYKEDAGRKEIQIKQEEVNKWEVLDKYYG